MSELVDFNHHKGYLDPLDDAVYFYGVRFSCITVAIEFLKNLEPSDCYRPWCYGSKRGVRHIHDDWIYYKGQWFPDERMVIGH